MRKRPDFLQKCFLARNYSPCSNSKAQVSPVNSREHASPTRFLPVMEFYDLHGEEYQFPGFAELIRRNMIQFHLIALRLTKGASFEF